MRIERKGPVGKLTPRLERFFADALGGQSLDDIQHAEERKADYECLRGLLTIELKTLEEDGSERINNLADELRERPDWPIFLGSAPMDAFLRHLDAPEEAKRRMTDRIGRAIRNHLHKANKQLGAHEAAFPRRNRVKIMVLVNEDHEIYSPEMVAYIVQHLLRREENGLPLYPHLDAVIFLSERHAAPINQRLGFPIVSIEGAPIPDAEWKRSVLEFFSLRWAQWNGNPLFNFDPREASFATIDPVPDTMKRHEQWELDYKRNRYMESFSSEQLRQRFDEVICISTLAFIKDSPLLPDKDAIMWSMSTMSHVMLEMGWRSIPATEFPHCPARLAAAAQRMNMPHNVIAWFAADLGRAYR